MLSPSKISAAAGVVCVAVVASSLALLNGHAAPNLRAGCPAGYMRIDSEQAEEFGRDGCIAQKHPESIKEMSLLGAQWAQKLGVAPPGVLRSALAQKTRLKDAQATIERAGGAWQEYGQGPLIASDPAYGVSDEGLGELNGRVDSFAYDADSKRLFALPGNGGLWMSEDMGDNWSAIGDNLPTLENGAVAWTSAGGGTLVVLSGNPDFLGSPSFGGLGAFWSTDLGKTWNQSSGIPDALFGLDIAVDHSAPNIIYAATSRGLFRSTDAGRSFANVALPTSQQCAGVSDLGPCQFANVVTGVAVKEPGGSTNEKGGEVLAAVGFQLGNTNAFPDGTVRSPGNGLYKSMTGEPGSFHLLDVYAADTNVPVGFTEKNRLGRVSFGAASGPDQDHNYVYAIVNDSQLMNGGLPFIDVNPGDLGVALPVAIPTVFNGIYTSADFGESWTRAADVAEILSPTSNSTLIATEALGIGPGYQTWYNLWIKPDPTTTQLNVPSRLAFGLEEVWSSLTSDIPQNGTLQVGPLDYHVVGSYFAGTTCLFLLSGVPVCPGSNPPTPHTTTHPDQHAGLFVPDGTGGVTLFAGNDGGVHKQHVAAGEAFDNSKWGVGANRGMYTLLPYNLAVSKDGTVWWGLQDNGSGKIEPDTRRIVMTFGGDGFFSAVDPDNSQVAYSEVANANMRVTIDGGQNWSDLGTPVANPNFSNPFVLDPTDSKHLMVVGSNIVETLTAPDICTPSSDPTGLVGTPTCNFKQVFDLGTSPVDGQQRFSSALDVYGDAAYVGFCGRCSGFGRPDLGVHEGIATNVGGDKPPKKGSSDGWHFATAKGLPNRYINWIKIDPNDTRTIYLAIGDYSSGDLAPPGTYLDATQNVGSGHVFVSHDAGENFTNISGDLPDTPAMSVTLRNNQLILGTQLGAFISSDINGTRWAALGTNLPNVPVTTVQISPGDPKLLLASTYGRGIWSYRFDQEVSVGGATGTRDTTRFGGALPLGSLVMLFGAGMLRRKLSYRP